MEAFELYYPDYGGEGDVPVCGDSLPSGEKDPTQFPSGVLGFFGFFGEMCLGGVSRLVA